MLSDNNSCDYKEIQEFPGPYKLECTPYYKLDFHGTTKQTCSHSFKYFSTNLNIAKVILLGDVAVGKTCVVSR